MADNRKCRIAGCEQTHPRHMYCCRAHWYALPKPYRDAIWRAYRSPGVFSNEYLQAAENAEAYLEDRPHDCNVSLDVHKTSAPTGSAQGQGGVGEPGGTTAVVRDKPALALRDGCGSVMDSVQSSQPSSPVPCMYRPEEARMQVFVIVDDRGRPVAVFSSRDAAQAHIDDIEKDHSAWQREVYGWRLMEFELDKEAEVDG